ncbi:hypothetical protein MGYG_06311 [Nannizzia gypsea CBS 118893]|uniref:Uncharacterized protein n=1 Tax=Arthroderma gypseum (strain ATCC MYA-4604 / CBS 118893) TaxID=535722 RepID=E4UYY2_ARTGP|nr:hypothetical protein MGYG_06311 [Nannizzia gypsea CBS 118893]EFR03312.1 hypothetical protein MGYG_06311 [Nannizzia gypsea CBS 118893]
MGFTTAGGKRGLASKRSAISLHDQQPVEPYTDEPSDEPPAYTDATPGSSNYRQTLPDLPAPRGYTNPYQEVIGSRVVKTYSGRESYLVTVHPEYSNTPQDLYNAIYNQAGVAPTVLISVKGTHTVKQRDGKKDSSSTVTDFDFRIETQGTILPISSYDLERRPLFDYFRELNVVRDGDKQSAYRGGRFKCKASKKYKPAEANDPEQAAMNGEQIEAETSLESTLQQWCTRYCEDKSGVKSFTLRSTVKGLDMNIIRTEIASIIRSTNYRGTINVTQETTHTALTVYSPHWINNLRTNRFVWWAVVILQLWIITWPIIILLERRYEPVTAQYYVYRESEYNPPFKGEVEWTKMFAPAISAAALNRRKDEIVTVADVQRATDAALNGRVQESPAERERRARMNNGNGTFMDSVIGIARGVSELRSEYDHARGWGANE